MLGEEVLRISLRSMTNNGMNEFVMEEDALDEDDEKPLH